MAKYHNTVTIPRSLEATFDYVSNFAHSGSWDPRVLNVKRTAGEGPVSVGTAFDLDSKAPVGTMVLPYRVIEFERPQLVVYTGSTRLFEYTDHLKFSAVDENTTSLTYDARMDLRGIFALGAPIFSLMFQRIGDDATERIAAAVVDHV